MAMHGGEGMMMMDGNGMMSRTQGDVNGSHHGFVGAGLNEGGIEMEGQAYLQGSRFDDSGDPRHLQMNPQLLYSSTSHQAQPPHARRFQQPSMIQRSQSHQGFSGQAHPPPPPPASAAMQRAQSAYSASNLSPHLNQVGRVVTNSDMDPSSFPSSQLSATSSPAGAKKTSKRLRVKPRAEEERGSTSARRGSSVSVGALDQDSDHISDSRSSRSGSAAPSPNLGTIADIEAIDPRSGPAPTEFQCPYCEKLYTGTHARSIWRRHLAAKHKIALSEQPRRSRWDAYTDRPKTEEEKRKRALVSKRRWARRDRLIKKHGKEEGAKIWEEEEEKLKEEDEAEAKEQEKEQERGNALGLGLFGEDQHQQGAQRHHQIQIQDQRSSRRGVQQEGKPSLALSPSLSHDQLSNMQLFASTASAYGPFPASAPGGRTLVLSSSPRRPASEHGRSPPVSPSRRVPQSLAARSANWLSGVGLTSASPNSKRDQIHRSGDSRGLPDALTIPFNQPHFSGMDNNSSILSQSTNRSGHSFFGDSSSSNTSDMERSKSDVGPGARIFNAGSDEERPERIGENQNLYEFNRSPRRSNALHPKSNERRGSTDDIYLLQSKNSFTLSSRPLVVGAQGLSSSTLTNKTPVTHYSDLYPTPPSMGNASSSGEPSRTTAFAGNSPTRGSRNGAGPEQGSGMDRGDLHKKRTGFGMSLAGQLKSFDWQAAKEQEEQKKKTYNPFDLNQEPPRPASASLVLESPSRRSQFQHQQELLISPNRDRSDNMLSLSQLPPRSMSSSIPMSKAQTQAGFSNSPGGTSLDFSLFLESGNMSSGSPFKAPLASASAHSRLAAKPSQLSPGFALREPGRSPTWERSQVGDGNTRMKPSTDMESPLARRVKASERAQAGPGRIVSYSPARNSSWNPSGNASAGWFPSPSQSISVSSRSSVPSTLMGSTPKRKPNPFSLDQHKISPNNPEEKRAVQEGDKNSTLPPMLGLTPLRSFSAPSGKRGRSDENEGHGAGGDSGASPLPRESFISPRVVKSVPAQRLASSTQEDAESSKENERLPSNSGEDEKDSNGSDSDSRANPNQTLFSSPQNLSLTNSLGLAPGSEYQFASTPSRPYSNSLTSGYTPFTVARNGGSSSAFGLSFLGMGFTPLGEEKGRTRSSSIGRNARESDSSFSNFISNGSPFANSLKKKKRKVSHSKKEGGSLDFGEGSGESSMELGDSPSRSASSLRKSVASSGR